MQNKKRLHKHLLMIYIIYFAALIVGILFLFMAEVLSLGTQLSEEQKLTI